MPHTIRELTELRAAVDDLSARRMALEHIAQVFYEAGRADVQPTRHLHVVGAEPDPSSAAVATARWVAGLPDRRKRRPRRYALKVAAISLAVIAAIIVAGLLSEAALGVSVARGATLVAPHADHRAKVLDAQPARDRDAKLGKPVAKARQDHHWQATDHDWPKRKVGHHHHLHFPQTVATRDERRDRRRVHSSQSRGR